MKLYIKPGLIVTPDEVIEGKGIYIDIKSGRIIKISEYFEKADIEIILPKDTIAFPGLINAHDHLLGTYWPRVSEGPHISWKPWDDGLKASELYKERSKIPNFYLYLFGAYKNLLSGVTTVMDHVPHKVNENFINKLPIRVIKNYTLAHEVSPYDLKWGEGIEIEHKKAVELNWPFVTHIEEGFDEESLKGIDYLKQYNALTDHTVMVHGLGLSDEDLDDIAKAKAHLITCPVSNYFMFKIIARLKEWFERNINVSLGTDSPMSGSINILEEMKFLKMAYKGKYGEDLDDRTILFMITKNPAKALRIQNEFGFIKQGYMADITIIKAKGDIYSSLVNAWFNDIEMVILGGKVIYAFSHYKEIFEKLYPQNSFSKAIIDGSERIIIGNLNTIMKQAYNFLGFKKELPFIPIELSE